MMQSSLASAAIFAAALILVSCAPQSREDGPEQLADNCPILGGDYEIIAMRRAGDVAGGPIDPSTQGIAPGDVISFGEALTYLGEEDCANWSAKERQAPIAHLDDPILSDLIVAPHGGLLASDQRGTIKHFELLCGEATIGALTKIDDRVLAAPSASGLTYVVLERPLSGEQIRSLQRALAERGFYDRKINGEMDSATQKAVSRFVTSFGGYDIVFARAAITRNLLAGIGIVADDPCSEPVSETVETRFPDYQPKLTDDTVYDYRPELMSRLDALPETTRENFQDAYVTLGELNRDTVRHPGRWEDGNVALGANPKEYVPSDEELLAAELGDRLAALVKTMTPDEVIDAWDGAAVVPPPVNYKHFDYRHVDVMGSGRFFYASPPKTVTIDIPA